MTRLSHLITVKLLLPAVAWYLRRGPAQFGRWRLQRWARGVADRANLKRQRAVITRHGFKMRVDQADWLGRRVWLTGEYEPEVAHVMKCILRKGDCAVDVGANQGFFTLFMAKCVGVGGIVHSFVPVPQTRRMLLHNISISDMTNCHVQSVAASNEHATLNIYPGPPEHSGIASLRVNQAVEPIQISAARLDDVIDQDAPVRLIKLDIEGAELKALQGAKQTIETHHPFLIIEVTDRFLRAFGDSAEAIRMLLGEHGYQCFRIDHDGLLPLDEFAGQDQFNIVAVPRDATLEGITIKQSSCSILRAG